MKSRLLLWVVRAIVALLLLSCSSPNEESTGEQMLAACPAGDPPEPTPVVDPQGIDAVIYAGQSNCASIANDAAGFPVGLPDSEVLYWPTIIARPVASDAFRPLGRVDDNTYGAEVTFGKLLKKPGRTVAILKVARGSTYISMWAPGGHYAPTYAPILLAELAQFKAALPPGPVRWHLVWDQGEQDARAALPTIPLQYGASFASLVAELEQGCECLLTTHIVRTNIALREGRQIAIVRAQQEQSSPSIIDSDNLATIDGTHRNGTSQGIVGARIAAAIEETP